MKKSRKEGRENLRIIEMEGWKAEIMSKQKNKRKHNEEERKGKV